MCKEINRVKRPKLRLNEDAIVLSLSILKKMEKPIELMYYLMEHEDEQTFVIMFISAKNVKLKKLLKKEKRDTDLLLTINKEDNLYALICQETKVDGAYNFSKRLMDSIHAKKGSEVYCTETEIRSTHYRVNEIIFKSVESYVSAKKDKRMNEIIFRSLS